MHIESHCLKEQVLEPDPDPYTNVTDPEHCWDLCLYEKEVAFTVMLCLGLIFVVCPGLCRLDYEPLVYDDDGNQQLLLSSRRVRRDEDGGEGSGLGEDYAAEDDDEDQEYFSSSTELLPSRQPGRIGCAMFISVPNCLPSRIRIFPSRIRIFSISDPNFFYPGSEFFPSRIQGSKRYLVPDQDLFFVVRNMSA